MSVGWISMRLTDYIPRGHRPEFAKQVDVSTGYLNRLCSGHERASADLCVRIERATLGRVTRVDLRPDLFGDLSAEAG